MSTDPTYDYLKGEWHFQGPSTHSFDELEVSISNKITLIKKANGKELERRVFPAQGSVDENVLLFCSHPCFFVKDANEKEMICGEKASATRGEVLWMVKVKRVALLKVMLTQYIAFYWGSKCHAPIFRTELRKKNVFTSWSNRVPIGYLKG